MQGIKLYPAAGYDLTSDEFRPVFELAGAFDVPVLVHTGYSFGPFLSKYSEPSVLDYLCDISRYHFHRCPLGGGIPGTALLVGLCETQFICRLFPDADPNTAELPEFARNIRLACDLIGSHRVLFGSDWPFCQGVMRNIEYLAAFNRLGTVKEDGAGFAGYEIKQMLGVNAEYLLNKGEKPHERTG
jgi:predicted TIM-barrel fold metal-dependent hydrolase